ncbi:MAG: beta-galactosidase [Candidatus Hydrogenedentes bacterium]|nr:beta-galactosidase [Candidatus Hydrogenedentota bacterium]
MPIWDATHLGHDPALPETHLTGTSEAEVAETLVKALKQPHDVLILGNMALDLLPEAAQQIIVEQLNAGMGLLLAHPRPAAPSRLGQCLTEATTAPAEFLTRSDSSLLTSVTPPLGDWLQTVQSGAGRIVRIEPGGPPPAYHGLLPFPERGVADDETYFENQFAFLARAMIWLAQREPEAWVTGLESMAPEGPREDMIPPDLTGEFVEATRYPNLIGLLQPFRLQLNAPTNQDYTLHVRVRRPGLPDLPEFEEPNRITRGQDSAALELLVGHGRFFIDTMLSTPKGTSDWFTQEVDLTGWPQFSAPAFSKKVLLPNDSMEISTSVPAILFRGAQGIFYARALDWQGNLLHDAKVPITNEGGSIRCVLHFAELDTPVVKVELYAVPGVMDHVSPIDLERSYGTFHYFPVRNPNPIPRPYVGVRLANAAEFASRALLDQIKTPFAITEMAAPASVPNALHAAFQGLRYWPVLREQSLVTVTQGHIRVPCLSDETYLNGEAARQGDLVRALSAGSSLRYFGGYGESLSTTEEAICFSPSCNTHYRDWMKSRYSDPAALNGALGTQSQAWEDVAPLETSPAQNMPWALHRSAMDAVFSDHLAHLRASLQEIDRQATLGLALQKRPVPYSGYDYYAMARNTNFLLLPPDPLLMRRTVSAQPPGAFSAIYLPNTHHRLPDRHLAWLAWQGILEGIPGLWLDNVAATAENATPEAFATPAVPLPPGAQFLSEALQTIHQGPGQLLFQATRAEPQVAVIESPLSPYLTASDAPEAGTANASASAWLRLLEHTGTPCRFLQIGPTGDLALTGYKAAIVPAADALPEATVRTLGEFAAQGGLVLFESAPRFESDPSAAQAALFETYFACSASPQALWASLPIESIALGVPELIGPAGKHTLPVDSGLRNSAAPDGEATVPVWAQREHGTGKIVLLNSPLAWWLRIAPGETMAHINALLEGAQVARPALAAAGHITPGTLQQFSFTYGDATLAAFLAAPTAGPDGLKLTMENSTGARIYDLLNPSLLGKKALQFKVLPGACRLLSLLPYEVKGVELKADPDSAKALSLRFACQVNAGKQKPGKHLLQVSCYQDLESVPLLRKEFEAPGGRINAVLSLPARVLSCAQLRLHVKDLLSGAEAEQMISMNLDRVRSGANSFGGTQSQRTAPDR